MLAHIFVSCIDVLLGVEFQLLFGVWWGISNAGSFNILLIYQFLTCVVAAKCDGACSLYRIVQGPRIWGAGLWVGRWEDPVMLFAMDYD